MEYYYGDNLGPAESFMDLVKKACEYDYYAFSDQDDYWEPNKLITAINYLEKEKTKGKLYFSTLKLVNENLKYVKTTSLPHNITFKKSILKNYASGCTMVFDNHLRKIAKNSNYDYIYMHDSYMLNLALLNDKFIYIDQNSYIKYRQHKKNYFGIKYRNLSIVKSKIINFFKYNHMSQKVAKSLLKNNTINDRDNYNFLNKVTNYNKNKQYKKELKKEHIFDKNEKIEKIIFKIKLFFNKI